MSRSLSVFIPFYNEEHILQGHVLQVYRYLLGLRAPFELFLVDDGSTDSTPSLCRSLAKKYPRIKYLRFDNGPSRRENLAQAFRKAKRDIVIYMDCDLAADLSSVRDLVEGIRAGHDIVIGSRYKGIKAKRSLYRLAWSKAYNMVVRTLFGTDFQDHQCGFKAFERKVILSLVQEAGYDETRRRGWFWDAEILLRAKRGGFSVLETPVKWEAGQKSSFAFMREIKTLGYMLSLLPRLRP